MSSAYERSKEFSEKKLNVLRDKLTPIAPLDAIAITVGSYARREASPQSDIDFFVATDAPASSEWIESVRFAVKAEIPRGPADDGAFDKTITKRALLNNIGGSEDSNNTITRRMLLLLEGEWLTNPAGFEATRAEMIERYLHDAGSDHHLALFLLNDIIRYWRTITVDYEYKTAQADNPKPAAIRLLKLTFSRKLIYAGGLFSVALTADRTPHKKQNILESLFSLPALDRLEWICEPRLFRPILQSYNNFLEVMEDEGLRGHLNSLTRDQMNSDSKYRDLKNEAHHYTRALLIAFEQTFHATHPIRRAVIL